MTKLFSILEWKADLGYLAEEISKQSAKGVRGKGEIKERTVKQYGTST